MEELFDIIYTYINYVISKLKDYLIMLSIF